MKIIRTRRKSVALIIERDGSLTVRAPLRMPQAQIEQLVQEKAAWIAEKQAHVQEHPAAVHRYQPGELFWFLGSTYPLEISASVKKPGLVFTDEQFHLSRAAANPAGVFERWYRAQAKEIIGARAEALARQHGYRYTSLRITGARSRWGSCGTGGKLNFAWRLVQAPPEVIDYVIVHELAHLIVRNHSRQFWERVGQHMPDYARCRKWLKEHTRLMTDDL